MHVATVDGDDDKTVAAVVMDNEHIRMHTHTHTHKVAAAVTIVTTT